MPTTGWRRGTPPAEPEERRVEIEYPAVRADQPVAPGDGIRCDADDGCRQREAARIAVEPGVAEGQHGPVRRGLPVALPVGRRRHADDVHAGHGCPGAVELGVAEGEHPAVRRHQPVPATVGGGRHADDGLVEVNGPGGAVERRRAEAEDTAVGGHQPVTAVVGRHGHAHDRLIERDVAGAAAVLLAPEREDPAVGGHGQIAVGRRRGYLASRQL